MSTKFYHSRSGVLILAYALVACIAIIDYQVGYEISTSILYLLPIYYLASSKLTQRKTALVIAAICSIAWLGIEMITRQPYSSTWILYWNAIVRGGIFFSIAIFVKALSAEQQKLKQANLELQKLNEEKNKFIGIAAHDLRSPIGNIYTLADLMLEPDSSKNLSPTQLEFLTLINRTSHNALSMLDNLLDVSQIEAGTLKINKIKNDYLEFIHEVISINQLIAAKKEQQILLESNEPEIILDFDKAYLGQVVNNLLTNALKYSFNKSEVTVKVSVNGKYIKTEVIDQGMGIKDQDKDKIFRPFEKAQNVPTGGERSSGLGLAIVRKIIEAHQGEIGFSSIYGKGSTFYFFLPIKATKANVMLAM
ncbi:sensor histidine kinase [Catalinimonas niigatensis]|uniref:sensor histidine kinase n=1 Tax=Catalinimonas niigatensis TaxID=1397264 RepID=UPI002664FE03|nr:HAMP domain-containing sensor histidine kinase [Catalinimonas niigatensis]WPP49392.1 HAMP domain-containing sensor histidine kinase [Catalinimonas niigatensis]